MLDSGAHSQSQRVASVVKWNRYVRHPPFILEALPNATVGNFIELTDRMPSIAEMEFVASRNTNAQLDILTLNFGFNRFYDHIWPYPGGSRSIPQLVDILLHQKAVRPNQLLADVQPIVGLWKHTVVSPGDRSTLCMWPLSTDVQRIVRRSLKHCFGNHSEFVVIRLRRSDRATEYPSERCSREGVAEAFAVSAAKRAAHGKTSDSTLRVFVATDEREASSLATIRAGISRVASRVCFEHDVHAMRRAPDNFMAYLAGVEMARRSSWQLHFHPGVGTRRLASLAPTACNLSLGVQPGWGVVQPVEAYSRAG